MFIKINPNTNNTNPVNIHLLIPNLSNIAISFEAQGSPQPQTPDPSFKGTSFTASLYLSIYCMVLLIFELWIHWTAVYVLFYNLFTFCS